MSVLERVAGEAGRAIAECGGKESSPLVAEVAAALAELAAEPPARRRRRRKLEARNPKSETNPKPE